VSDVKIMNDIRVIAAIDALKRTVLQVTGKSRVQNLVVIIEAQNVDDPEGFGGHLMTICNCPTCTKRLRAMFNDDIDHAEADWDKDQAAVH
jgi:hypothetical protein